MAESLQKGKRMRSFYKHIESYILRGIFASIPLVLCYLAITLLYNLIDKKVVTFLNKFFDVSFFPGLGIFLVLLIMYLTGLIVSNFIGRSFFKIIENISERIPVIKVIYGIGKQLSQSLDMSDEKKGFQKAVLINFDNRNVLVPGFITGYVIDEQTGEERPLVFMPTSPAPSQGFIMAVPLSQIVDPGWTVEEAFKVVVSAGIIAPKMIQANSSINPPKN